MQNTIGSRPSAHEVMSASPLPPEPASVVEEEGPRVTPPQAVTQKKRKGANEMRFIAPHNSTNYAAQSALFSR